MILSKPKKKIESGEQEVFRFPRRMKVCTICGVPKPPSEYYAHKQTADRRMGECKECVKSKARTFYWVKDRDLRKERGYRVHPNHATHNRNWRQRNPEKYAAESAVGVAIRAGKLVRKPCSVCGSKAHAHHDDYSKKLDVVWLCPTHHKERHLIYEPIR